MGNDKSRDTGVVETQAGLKDGLAMADLWSFGNGFGDNGAGVMRRWASEGLGDRACGRLRVGESAQVMKLYII